MEGTLFTALSTSEEANLSGGGDNIAKSVAITYGDNSPATAIAVAGNNNEVNSNVINNSFNKIYYKKKKYWGWY
ncbi:hypothetical protein LC605_04805 [Nostoc sp. CHAB 5836]|uniref:hypothetical protein n=1 Tax=Nostoc sp. CHAB 5836 TaxID=2780404 RepID=UPI001E51D0EB|nr:hypothetical protein [Nostoc sp. CHAB 5836]MCC5614407.1 hypothetical protein [Nostoc sp. CHAB 5836]